MADMESGGHAKIAAIDNGLAFPFKHPDEWRACESSYLVHCLTCHMMQIHFTGRGCH